MPHYTAADRARFFQIAFDRLSDGESLDDLAATPGWPSRPTLRAWARADPNLGGLIGVGQYNRTHRTPAQRYPYRFEAAEALLRRLGRGEPLSALLGQDGLPHRRALNSWKATRPEFAAAFKATMAFVDADRRRTPRRRTRVRYTEAGSDRIILAVMRGARLADVLRHDPTLPGPAGVRRWRREHPEFDGALRSARKVGLRLRLRAKAYDPAVVERIERELIEGASLNSLSQRPDMPSAPTLYKWVRDRPDFAEMVDRACRFRDAFFYTDQACERLDRGDLRGANAILKHLGALNPHPGQRRRDG